MKDMKASLLTRLSMFIIAVTVFIAICGGSFVVGADEVSAKDEWMLNCHVWPPTGVPPEHLDNACNKAVQNAAWAVEHEVSQSSAPEDIIPDVVYLNMAEEKTWVCPLDDANNGGGANNFVFNNNNNGGIDGQKSNGYTGTTGHPTRWVLHNRASNPIIITHLNVLGLEVSSMDKTTFPPQSNTAVYPDGPIVLPNTFAVVEGLQGQLFFAREYKELLPMDAAMNEEYSTSWNSFKDVLPSTLSFLPHQSRYETNKGVVHVLGHPEEVLMKHRMGNIYVKNQFGAMCPEMLGGDDSGDDEDEDLRKGSPKDMNPDCNVQRKAFINKVGCPIDIYFSPLHRDGGDKDYDCEIFGHHLGPLDTFLSQDPNTRDVDGHDSPLKFENTYNGHYFSARMSHDNSLVARIELNHDIVTDCPERKRSSASVDVQVDDRVLSGVPVGSMTNATAIHSPYDLLVGKVNDTTASSYYASPRKYQEKRKHDIHWRTNHTGIISHGSSFK